MAQTKADTPHVTPTAPPGVLLALLATPRGKREKIATRAVEPLAAMLRREHPEPVRAAASLCVARFYDTDRLRRTFVVGFRSRDDLEKTRKRAKDGGGGGDAAAALLRRSGGGNGDGGGGGSEGERQRRSTETADASFDFEVMRQHDALKDLFDDALNPHYFPRFSLVASSGASAAAGSSGGGGGGGGGTGGDQDGAVVARASVHERALRALLNLCADPDVRKFVRERHEARCRGLVDAFISEARTRVSCGFVLEPMKRSRKLFFHVRPSATAAVALSSRGRGAIWVGVGL